jgi:hypothetical protein
MLDDKEREDHRKIKSLLIDKVQKGDIEEHFNLSLR